MVAFWRGPGGLLPALVLGCALWTTAAAAAAACSYRSLHAHELAVHTHRTFRVDCSSAGLPPNVTWSLPSGCTIVEAAGAAEALLPRSTIDATCTTPGLKVFRASHDDGANGTEAQAQIDVTRTNLCHDWFVAQVTDSGAASVPPTAHVRRVVLRAWLYTYPSASAEEQSGTACHPSTASQHLTREFQRLGERPRVQVTGGGESVSVAGVSWDEERTCWDIELEVAAAIHRHHMQLDGQHIGVLGCHVRPRAAMLVVSASTGAQHTPTLLSALEGTAVWRAVGCGAAGSQPPALAAHAAATTSSLEAYAGGTLLLGAPDSATAAHDWCGDFGLATTLLLRSLVGDTTAEAILVSRTAAEAARVLTLPLAVRSVILNDSTHPGCDVVLTRRRWAQLTASQQDETVAALLIAACGQQVLLWANDTWSSVAPWATAAVGASSSPPAWNAHVQTLSSCASFDVWKTAAPVLLWTDEPVAAAADGTAAELPLYSMADGGDGSWEIIAGLRSFADAHIGRTTDAAAAATAAVNSSASWSIQAAVVLESVPHFVILLKRTASTASGGSSSSSSSSTRHLFVLNREQHSWTAGAFSVDASTSTTDATPSDDNSCKMQMIGASAGTPELYLWDTELWYSSDGGLHLHRASLLQADGSSPSPSAQPPCIQSVITSENGQVIARTEGEGGADRLYWGYVGFPHLVEIGSGGADGGGLYDQDRNHLNGSSAATIVSFDLLGQPIVRSMSHLSGYNHDGDVNDNGELTQTRVHFSSRLVARDRVRTDAVTGLHACPYRHLTSDLPAAVYLDKGESVDASITVDSTIPGTPAATVAMGDPAGAGAVPRLSVSSSNFDGAQVQLSVNETDTLLRQVGMVGTTEVTVSAPRQHTTAITTRSTRGGDGFAFATVTVRVGTSSLQCNADVVSTMGVNIGCPPGRSIRVVHQANCEQQQQELSEADRESAETWRDAGSPYTQAVGVGGSADTDLLGDAGAGAGCAQRLYHGSAPWRPRVVLYDWDTAKEDVTADYVVFERTGRTDYTFNATEAQAGCTRPAQTTEAVYRGEPYVSCSGHGDAAETTESASQLYEVLSAGGVNALQFTTPGGNGRFVFGLRVVDPTYSHCALETTFLVDVYGAPIDGSTSLAITLSTIGVIVCSLAVSFVCFRRSEGWRAGAV